MLKRLFGTSAAVAALTTIVGSAVLAGPAAAVGVGPQRVGAIGTINSIDCTSGGNCTAVGNLEDPSSPKVLFAVTEKNGVWGSARGVPGVTALLGNHDPFGSQFRDLSCPSAGNCGAGGYYAPGVSTIQALVASETKGTWGKAQAVKGLAKLNVGHDAEIDSIACATPGNCSAGGFYTVKTKDILADTDVFVVNERNGVWGKAEEIPGTAKLNSFNNAQVEQIACPSPGDCTAVGYYSTSETSSNVFSVTEKNGTWGKAQAVPGIPAGEHVVITRIVCHSANNCTGAGTFSTGTIGVFSPFAINEVNGKWGKITALAGVSASGAGDQQVLSLSCPTPGDCTAAGNFRPPSGPDQPFVVAETNGVWGTAQPIPGVVGLSSSFGGEIGVGGVVCESAGNCSAAGHFFAKVGDGVFVSTEKNGVWGQATALPGLQALNVGREASIPRLDCGADGSCSLGGFYARHAPQGGQVVKPYLAVQKNGTWGAAKEVSGVEP